MQGRKPIPTALKLARGNPGKRPIHDAEPALARGIGDAPDWLDDEARRQWEAIAPDLDAAGVLCRVDAPTLGAYCQAVSRLKAAEAIIAREGLIITGSHGGKAKHPAAAIAKDAAMMVHRLAGEFGLTPSSRTRLGGVAEKTPPDAFDEWMQK